MPRIGFLLLLHGIACGPTSGGPADAADSFLDAKDNGCGAVVSDSIFVVNLEEQLLRFSPADNQFAVIGKLDCPNTKDETPFSMSVNRDGIAWVLYSDGGMYHVDTRDASCKGTGFQKEQLGFDVFGMGFVSDEAGGDAETLFISKATDGVGDSVLGKVDGFNVSAIGTLASDADNSPELTGTGAGQLYGYFPGTSGSEVQRIDKNTGSTLDKWSVASARDITAWAFAHYAGNFYIFRSTNSQNQVVRFSPGNGSETTVVGNSPHEIVGAGVSTCAPVNPD